MLLPNTRIHNRYRIVRLLSESETGAVYKAIDEEQEDRVALKQVLVGGIPELDRTFERRVQSLARLRHPSLPLIRDAFTDEAGQFLVMQFVPGDDLATQLAARGKAFFLEQMLRWTSEALEILEYLHSRQPPVLHRDIKPQNLKVGERGELLLLDFGFVTDGAPRRSQGRGGESPRGYPSPYLPLEQLRGEDTDQRSDLYALAATLYHLATNQLPVDALTRVSYIKRQQPDPLRPPREINPLLPATFANLLLAALSLDPAKRPSSAQSMRFALYEEKTGRAPALPVPRVIVEPSMPIAEREEQPARAFTARPIPAQPAEQEPPVRQVSPAAVTRPKTQPIRYLWMVGTALAFLLLTGGAWLLSTGATERPMPTATPAATLTLPATPLP